MGEYITSMEAGGRHPMPHSRRLPRLFAALFVLACLLAMPAAAGAAVTLPDPNSALQTVGTTVSSAAAPRVERATTTVTRAVPPAVAAVTAPAPQPAQEAAQQVVQPVASAAQQAVPAATGVVHNARRSVHGHAAAARIARGASSERLGAGRTAQGSAAPTAQPAALDLSPAARAAARKHTPVATAAQPASAPSHALPEQSGGAAGAPASGLSASFFFGGGLALLAGALLLTAGPRLRRHLKLPSVVCRPAAFIAVLERPG
jgi:hypothetical protein